MKIANVGKLSHAWRRELSGRAWETANKRARLVKQALDKAVSAEDGFIAMCWRDKYVNVRADGSGDVVVRYKAVLGSDAMPGRVLGRLRRQKLVGLTDLEPCNYLGRGVVLLVKVPFKVTRQRLAALDRAG